MFLTKIFISHYVGIANFRQVLIRCTQREEAVCKETDIDRISNIMSGSCSRDDPLTNDGKYLDSVNAKELMNKKQKKNRGTMKKEYIFI